ncbi:MAG TPA: hypothetical protein VGR43_10765 [Dehalococcoidia bacterium]|jgi:hypothetical protein|nr:hypothetical protein [Dehalococcoidia bacterium]
MAQERRQKASDVFREKQFLFGGKSPFEKAFPQIEEVHVEAKLSALGIPASEAGEVTTYTKSTLPGEYIDCPNPSCYNGGFSIGAILHEMVRGRLTEHEPPRQKCQGYEGSPKGRTWTRDCINSWKVKVSIRYKPEQQEAANHGSTR